jgi:hypothetical protein
MGFGIVAAGGLGVIVVAVLLLGYYYPGTGADVLDWRPTRSIELEAELEIDDLQQMLAAQNERRRRRGARERSLEEIERQVASDMAEQQRRRAAYLAGRESTAEAQRDLEDLLAATNERRRRRGEAPITAEQYRWQLHAPGDDDGPIPAR